MVDSPQVNQIIKKQNYYEIQIQAYLNDAQTSFPISYSYKYQNTFSRNVQFHFCCLVLLVCQPKEWNRRLVNANIQVLYTQIQNLRILWILDETTRLYYNSL